MSSKHNSNVNNTDFFKHYHSDLFKLTNEYCAITKKTQGKGVIYGSRIIPYNTRGIHEWKLKVSPLKKAAVTIGVSQSPEIYNGEGQVEYGYSKNGKRRGPYGIEENFSDPYTDGGVVHVILDLNKKELRFKKNNGYIKTAFNIGRTYIGYSLAVYIGGTQTGHHLIQLLSYSHNKANGDKWKKGDNQSYHETIRGNQRFDGNINDESQTMYLEQQIDDLIFENKEINKALDSYEQKHDECDFETLGLMQRLNKSVADNKRHREIINVLNDQLNQMETRNESLNKVIQRLQTDNLRLKEQYDFTLQRENAEILELKAANRKLIDQRTEYQLQIKELMNMNKKLQMNAMNISSYKEWSTNDVLLWIMSLDNGRYLKYQKILNETLNEEEICGDDLDKVDSSDIKGWGILNFKDKKYLKQQINDLTKYQNNNINEGVYHGPTANI